ncbi:D-alanine--poly(phosphoribitol) ligase subunit 2 [Mediterraneibacter sp. NSJ-55]|uniref:D-alanine--poly(Phosphoribitol) ligase subunit 2 n=1 Tax=Mediterraneibacter hominis TaxID=2763054 RepID=A0A923LF99_9FIRM|nr:phosphopantetheine-binding protein [Mediterraneibacter hominis]MBC5687536.1 D-alanine--poly(phosphoribitol) ligase subunit 2 [Mediterraneibacter hominis]
MENLKEIALKILEEACETDEVREDEELDLFEAGYLDSLGIVSVLLGIEEKCGIRLQPTDIQKEDISTVTNFVKYLEKKVQY